jgi:CheY-like chemotaxis protein
MKIPPMKTSDEKIGCRDGRRAKRRVTRRYIERSDQRRDDDPRRIFLSPRTPSPAAFALPAPRTPCPYGWSPRLEVVAPARVLLIEPWPGLLWAVEARVHRLWPRAEIFRARNGVEGCLLAGRTHPELVVVPSEVPQIDVIVLIRRLKRPALQPRPVVVLATALPADDPIVREAVDQGVDAVLPLG